ncbi:hyaluronan and proteoglycan link protein 1 [Oryzias melastigma]|uniref:Hyaluronan and proteoglycan link protein 1a n=1 Tax=Oryzias melastigma TaxID=30732 RepID=A0A3B3BI04_ORYME|nr:hyaluronan and proteoglycan link protein 1 [Oryzias melastigma]
MMSLLCITVISLTLTGRAYCETNKVIPVKAKLGATVTLPCQLEDSIIGHRVLWYKADDEDADFEELAGSMGLHEWTSKSFNNRVYIQKISDNDASLVITDVSKDDIGRYRCEIINGEEETLHDYELMVESDIPEGVVFPYSPHGGRYSLNFERAEKACADQGAVVASFEQLFQQWEDGFDWCNAGWLNDGTVQYPINKPREPCGGSQNGPGLRNYGKRNKKTSRYDVFCYVSKQNGHFYWLVQPERLSFDEAVQACLDDGAEIAKVGHMYAAWRLEGYDRCDAGWLADGSVRYPIANPRKNCSPTEAAVRFVGFPDKKKKSYGVYCFRPEQ